VVEKNQDQYPTLAKIIDKHRNSLSSEMVEALICAKDWLKVYLSDDENEDGKTCF
jgi:hypothetical protein